MGNLGQDLRYGLRMLARTPGFTAVAILTLGLGIGANTAIFSLVDAVLLRPLPYPQPQQLLKLWMRFTGIGLPKDRNWVSPPEFRDLQTLNRSFSSLAALNTASFNVTAAGSPERVEGAAVSPSLFPMLGVSPVLGRAFLPEEAQPGRDRELLLGYGLWQRRFGGDPGIVGRTLEANGAPMLVVGVLPKGFDYPFQAELWQPLAFTADQLGPNYRGAHGLEVLGRIKPGMTPAQAGDDMAAVTSAIVKENPAYPYRKFNFAVLLVPLLEDTVGDVQTALWVLVAAVGFVLLIGCVNVASLLLARASARQKEMAIRVALGAGPGRITRQLLTESVTLAALGGVAGIFLAPLILFEITRMGSVALPRISGARIDAPVLAFTALISVATGILFGLAPAWQARRSAPSEELKEGGRGGGGGAASSRMRAVLVAAETAIAVGLLVGAGLLLRSFLRVLSLDQGFRAASVLTMRVSLPATKYNKPEQVSAFYQDILRGIDRLPGVIAAGATAALPLSGLGGSGTTTIDTTAVPPDQATPETDWRPVTPGYFQAMGIPVLRGRDFTESDIATAAPVAIVDDALARTYWPNENPIGKRLRLGGLTSTAPWKTVVGVVGHLRYRALEDPSRPQLYWPEAQQPRATMSLAIRTGSDPLGMAGAVEGAIHAVDPDQPVYQIRTIEQLKSDWMASRRLSLVLVGLFAAVALALAAVGIFGVMAYSVARRSHEIGIRMALGARPGDVLRLVLGHGASLVGAGLAVGAVVALALVQLMKSLLYRTSTVDPATFIAVGAVLLVVALAACYVPAHRAMRVDPTVALRYQ
ncbi:MAG TPA: ABC transporter permease [Candidatus Acidoferrales bacterium]|nr:ABC transporter permease [Candidatus Acidoferrales bacterium]